MIDNKLDTLLHSYEQARLVLEKKPEVLPQLVDAFLKKIEKYEELNAFVEVYREESILGAEKSVHRFQEKKARKLEGMIVGLKDLFCYEGHRVQGASKILEGFVSQVTATSVQRLLDEGAIMIGRQNCDEFGMGTGNENSVYGSVKNGLAPDRVPGGSSGGSAVAVQMGMCHVALGSDTGGSVRQPASFCGILGLRPTYGLISRYGLLAYASSFDTVGILSHTIKEMAAVLGVVAGNDGRDNTLSRKKIPNYLTQLGDGRKTKVAYLENTLSHEGIQEEVKGGCLAFIKDMKEVRHEVAGINFPLLDYALPVYYVLTTAEASANLACYDGVRYGYRAPNTTSYEELIQKTRTLGFGTEVKRRILLGNFLLSAECQEVYYKKAQKVRQKIKRSLEKILEQYEFIVLPTAPTTAYKLEAHKRDPMKNYLADLYTVVAAVAGLPAISIPYGHDAKGLPIGVQVIGRAFEESRLLSFAEGMMEDR